jgi:hypothetical protein
MTSWFARADVTPWKLARLSRQPCLLEPRSLAEASIRWPVGRSICSLSPASARRFGPGVGDGNSPL